MDFPEGSVTAFRYAVFAATGRSNAFGSNYEVVAVRSVDPPGYVSAKIVLAELVKLCEAFVRGRSRTWDVLRDRNWKKAHGDALAAELFVLAFVFEFLHLFPFVWLRSDFDHIHECACLCAERKYPFCGGDKVEF